MQIKIPFSSQNVRTLQASTNSLERKTALISKGVLNKYNIDIEALSETIPDYEQLEEKWEDSTFFSGKQRMQHALRVLLSEIR